MLQDLMRRPQRRRQHMRTLADLHQGLHQLPPLKGLDQPFGTGDALLHADLQPDNVLLGADGPVVVDWTNACRGPAGADVATAWLLLACAGLPVSGRERAAQRLVRKMLVSSFLSAAASYGEREPGRAALSVVLEQRRLDPNMSSDELARMTRLVARAGRSLGL